MDIRQEVELGQGNNHTVVAWCNFYRDMCEDWIMNNPMEVGGFDADRQPMVVEINETKYFHWKYHLGQWREGH